jgi:alcohol dehydrogenase class IV
VICPRALPNISVCQRTGLFEFLRVHHFYSQSQGAPDCFAPAVQDFRADAEAEFMERLAKLSGLSQAQKDHLIHSLWSIIGELRQEVSGLREQAHRLEIEKTSLQA